MKVTPVFIYGTALALVIGGLALLRWGAHDDSAREKYKAEDFCGRSYPIFAQHKMAGAIVYLGHDAVSDSYCGITIRDGGNESKPLEVSLQVGNHPAKTKSTSKDVAGPIFLSSGGECITWGGRAGEMNWRSPSSLCAGVVK